uniref:Peptidase S1 domain-containing protein n=1 Tax=Nothoprocta perdicaria TaxID=30464 RepID=A0A8C6YRP3_NOTPE
SNSLLGYLTCRKKKGDEKSSSRRALGLIHLVAACWLDQGREGTRDCVKTIIIHEKYRYPEHDYDIALVKLSKQVEFTSNVHRVCLPEPSQTFPYNIYAVITGWGALTNDGPTPNVLQEATVKLIDSNTCNRKEVYDGDITPRMLCAGYLEGGVDACQGDSGGPLVTPDSRLMWYLVGIVSWGDECAKPNKPGVYTRKGSLYFRFSCERPNHHEACGRMSTLLRES